MARIRTIKPEFFTSEDIVSLTPLARLFYVSLWCEADREGRFEWKPKTLKMRYLPADDCDVSLLCDELVTAGLVVLYEANGRTYSHIPGFTRHQVINNREQPSDIPEPPRVKDASTRVQGEGRKEGKGIVDASKDTSTSETSGKPTAITRGSRLPNDWLIPQGWELWAIRECGWSQTTVTRESSKFRDFWVAKSGKDATKVDWEATWRNWCRNSRASPEQQSRSAWEGAI